jgi:hypothetical protein
VPWLSEIFPSLSAKPHLFAKILEAMGKSGETGHTAVQFVRHQEIAQKYKIITYRPLDG